MLGELHKRSGRFGQEQNVLPLPRIEQFLSRTANILVATPPELRHLRMFDTRLWGGKKKENPKSDDTIWIYQYKCVFKHTHTSRRHTEAPASVLDYNSKEMLRFYTAVRPTTSTQKHLCWNGVTSIPEFYHMTCRSHPVYHSVPLNIDTSLSLPIKIRLSRIDTEDFSLFRCDALSTGK